MGEGQNVVLGGGLAGLTAAMTLQEAGEADWTVLERGSKPGGHASSVLRDGYVFDYGPHILFTADPGMEALIRDLLGDNLRSQERRALIFHEGAGGIYTRFPFQAHLHGLPVPLVRECLVELVRAVEARARGEFAPRNYEDWMRGTFGDAIADRLMIPYARKIWTVEPATMDFTWIGRRVPTPDVERIVLGALTDDVEQIGATAQFWYPWRGGIEALPTALAERVRGVETNREIRRIDLERRVVTCGDGDEIAFGDMIFTLPLNRLTDWFVDLPTRIADRCARLQYQGIFNVNVGVHRETLSDAHWVYFYEDAYPFHRLSFPGNFSPHNVPEGRSSVSVEVAFSRDRPLDRDAMIDRTLDALRRAGILAEDDEIDLVHAEEISPAYVIYDLEHRRNVDEIRGWLEEQRVWTAGRFGEWGYLNMDHAMASGRAAGESVLRTRVSPGSTRA
jgi:UDP-galactopyranose mutase